jgi:hypothetical protein
MKMAVLNKEILIEDRGKNPLALFRDKTQRVESSAAINLISYAVENVPIQF